MLRKISFSIYQEIAMTAQYFILLVTLVFTTATYILYASIYYVNAINPETGAS